MIIIIIIIIIIIVYRDSGFHGIKFSFTQYGKWNEGDNEVLFLCMWLILVFIS